MITLTLARDNSGKCVGLQLPAEPADIAAAYKKLDAISTDDRQTHILRAETGVGSMDRWLRDRPMDRPGDYIELGELAERIDRLDEQQRKTFDGALTGAAFNSVTDVLRIAYSLENYKEKRCLKRQQKFVFCDNAYSEKMLYNDRKSNIR